MKDLELNNWQELFKLVLLENQAQLNKWGSQDHAPSEWFMFTTEEVGELSQAISEWIFRNGKPIEIVKEAIQVATLSLKIAEMFLTEE